MVKCYLQTHSFNNLKFNKMNKKFKSLVAIVLACTLGLGVSSCKKNEEPDPTPEPEITSKFDHKIAFNQEMADYYDVTFTYTSVDGQTATANLKDCPVEKHSFETGDQPVEYNMYVFNKGEETKKHPAETSVKVTFKYNGNVPQSGEIDIVYKGIFEAGGLKRESSRLYRGLPAQDLEAMAATMNENYSQFVLKVDDKGNPTFVIPSGK